MLYREKDYLAHYGVKGMRWGHRKNIYDVNASYYNRRAGKFDARAKKNRLYASMNEYAAKTGSGLIRNATRINANYYNKKAAKLSNKAKKNRLYASMNETASKHRNERKQSAEYKAKRAKALKTGAAVAGAALATYGTYKVSKYLKSEAGRRSYKDGQYFVDAYIKNASKEPYDAHFWYSEARRVARDTDKRTKIVKSSTIDAIRYLKNPDDERWSVYKR